MKLKNRKIMTAYIFLIIPIVFYSIVRFYPTFLAFFISFTNWNLISPEWRFVGFKNYIEIFKDHIFLQSLLNTLKYVLFGVL